MIIEPGLFDQETKIIENIVALFLKGFDPNGATFIDLY